MTKIVSILMCLPLLQYPPTCVNTIFRTDSGPIGNSRNVGEDRNPLIRPHAASVPRYYKSHVSSKWITLQRESPHPTVRGQIQIYDPWASTIPLLWPKRMENYPTLPCICELSSPKTLSPPSPLFCGCKSSRLELTVGASPFNFLHHLATHFYVTVFF